MVSENDLESGLTVLRQTFVVEGDNVEKSLHQLTYRMTEFIQQEVNKDSLDVRAHRTMVLLYNPGSLYYSLASTSVSSGDT